MRFRIFTEPQQGASYFDQLRMAQAAEALGFDAFFRSDHFMVMGSGDGLPGPTDSWTTLAGLARETSTIRLGTLVSSATHRVPAILAIQVAQVDDMSGGRVELGLGTGWFGAEHAAYGIPFPAKRFDLLAEQLAIITGLWQTPIGDTFSFDGQHYRLVDAPALPKPVQSPVPVVIGGAGPTRTPQLAAQYATEYNIGFRPEAEINQAFDRVRKAAIDAGRDPVSLRLSIAQPTAIGRTHAEFQRRADTIGHSVDQLTEVNLGGSIDQVVDRLGRYRELGADTIYFQILDFNDIDLLELIAQEVVPQVK